jgi:hypothetical protein
MGRGGRGDRRKGRAFAKTSLFIAWHCHLKKQGKGLVRRSSREKYEIRISKSETIFKFSNFK